MIGAPYGHEDPHTGQCSMTAECDVLALLRARYTRIRPGTDADRYVRAEQVRYPSDEGYGLAAAIADYLVFDTYGRGEILGFEITASRADWLEELRNRAESDPWRAHVNRWYVVTSDRSIVRGDLPEGWGHMTVSEAGLRVATQSALTEAVPMTGPLLAQCARAVAQTAQEEATSWQLLGAL